MSTQEIRDIYKKITIQREQASTKLKKEVKDTLGNKLNSVFGEYFKLLQDPKVSVAEQDEVKRQMNEMFETILMDSDHDVIMALTNNVLMEKAQKKNLEKLE